jgi:hypothetical protein
MLTEKEKIISSFARTNSLIALINDRDNSRVFFWFNELDADKILLNAAKL